jgi:hypothetical protein
LHRHPGVPHTFHCSLILPGNIGPTFASFFFSRSIFSHGLVMSVSFCTDSKNTAIGILAQKKAGGKLFDHIIDFLA